MEKKISFNARLIKFLIRISGVKNLIGKELNKKQVNHRNSKIPKYFYKEFDTSEKSVEGRSVWIISPKIDPSEKVILYLHGGAYIFRIQKIYWSFIKEVIQKTKVTVIFPDYPVAPEQTSKDTYQFLEQLYETIMPSFATKRVSFMGDSAGGGLALGFAQWLSKKGGNDLKNLILLSPWLDLNLDNPRIDEIENADVMLEKNGLRKAGKLYSGESELSHYSLSPIFGNLNNLPTISIFIGTDDILLPDCEILVAKLKENKITHHYFVFPKLFHAWMVIAPKLKESKLVISKIQKILDKA